MKMKMKMPREQANYSKIHEPRVCLVPLTKYTPPMPPMRQH
jgi:hypothetical protein